MPFDAQDSDFTPPTINEIAKLLPAYEILSFIAKGGMGAVYKAKQKSLDRLVAIKILPRHFGEDKEFRESFETEAKSMAKLNHPNLIGIYDFGEVDGLLYIIMELVEGESLYHFTYNRKLQESEAAQMVHEICLGLENAHQHGILHRDIKPSNILLTPSHSPKIGDFGLARPVTEHEKDSAFGTPGYTAPEVVHHPKAVDESTDLYSVGILLYELLTGKIPDTAYIPAASLVQCSPQFDQIIRRAIHPSPKMRFRSASEMAEALAPLLNNKQSSHIPKAPTTKPLLATTAVGGATIRGATIRGARPISPAVRPVVPIKKSSNSFARNLIIVALLLLSIVLVANSLQNKRKKEAKQRAAKEALQKIAKREAQAKKEALERRQKEQKRKQEEERRRKMLELAKAPKIKTDLTPTSFHEKKTTVKKEPQPVYVERADSSKELDKIHEKCAELVRSKQEKHDQLLKENLRALKMDLRSDLRLLPKSMKESYEDEFSELLDDEITDKIPGKLEDYDFPKAAQKSLKERFNKQLEIDVNYSEQIEKIRAYYRKNLHKLKNNLTGDKKKAELHLYKRELESTEEGGQSFIDFILSD